MKKQPAPLILILSLMMATLTAWAQTPAEIMVRDSSLRFYDDGGTCAFESLRLGLSTSVSFTITNQGELPLTGLALTVDGAHPEDYVITQDLALTELTQGVSTTFTLEFKPTTTGVRTAALHIANNDSNEGPFDIPLYGEGSLPEIRVEDSQGNEIVQGGTYSFGSRSWSQLGTQHGFAIQNTGVGALKMITVNCTGANADDFYVGYTSGLNVARPGADVGLVVTFKPLTYGLRTATITIVTDDEDEGTFQFTVTGTGLVPGLQVEQVADTPLVDDANVAFGAAGINEPTGKPVTLTIKNPGTKPLTLGATLLGDNVADFAITSAPAPTLQPGQSTTVTVLFVPKADGARQTRLRFAHNAMLNGATTSFYIRLNGQGVNSEIEFDSPVFTALHGDTQGLVKLKRTEAGVPATVELQTLAGLDQAVPPFKAAKPDVDFTALSGQAAVVTFAAGEAEKTVSVPLLAPAAGAKINRHLKLQLANPSSGAVLTSPDQASLRILGTDTVKPSLTVTAPAAGKVSTILPFVVTGKAGDAMGIDRVEVKVGDADPVTAELASTNSNTTVPFTCPINPANGTQDIVVTAYDLRGNSTSVTRTITFTRRHTLNLNLGYDYEGSALNDGTVSLVPTPAAAATPLSVNGNERKLSVLAGTKLKLTAKSKAGIIFRNWNVHMTGNSEILQQSNLGSELTLTMPDTDLHVSADFARTVFPPAAGESKSLHWLLTPDSNPASPVAAMTATTFISGTLADTGSFSGKLHVNGHVVPIVAMLFHSDMTVFTVAGKKRASLPYPGGELVIASQQGGFQAIASPTNTDLPQMYGTPRRGTSTATKGYYTVQLTPTGPVFTTTPSASGYATMNLTTTGTISLVGVLSDGTAVTSSTALLTDDKAFMFAQLPTPGGTTKLGLVSGVLEFGGSDVGATALNWFRPAAASAKVLLYPAGWPGGLPLDANGTLYSATKTAQFTLFGLTSNTPSPARLHFTGGKLASPIEKTNFGLKGNTVVKTAPADGSYTLSIAPATGIFSGTFTGTFTPNGGNPISAKPAFKGVILQKGAGSAAGFFINNAKGETAPESGAVTLGAPVP